MKAKDYTNIIWDLDGTKYQFHQDLESMVNDSLKLTLQENAQHNSCKDISLTEIGELSQLSLDQCGLSWPIFCEKFGIDRTAMFEGFNRNMTLKSVEQWKGACENTQLNTLLDSLNKTHIQSKIFTHGSKEWAGMVLNKLGLNHHYPTHKIFDLSDVGWTLKSDGANAFKKLKQLSDYNPETTIMVDDSPKCLQGAKQMGTFTILINDNSSEHLKYPFIDKCYPNPLVFLEDLLRSNN